MTTNPWKSVQRALTALTSAGKAKIQKLKLKASGKSLPKISDLDIFHRRGGGVRVRPLALRAGRLGSRPARWLDDASVARARIKSEDINHQMKFMSPMKRIATALALAP